VPRARREISHFAKNEPPRKNFTFRLKSGLAPTLPIDGRQPRKMAALPTLRAGPHKNSETVVFRLIQQVWPDGRIGNELAGKAG
jgi:hypothetical protein